MAVHRYPPLPRYTPAEGNPFDWVLRAAAAVRAERQALDERRWAEQEASRRAARKANP